MLELDKLDLTEPVRCLVLIKTITVARCFDFCSVTSTCCQFQKRQERDLLDQKKEKEETLLLEMVSLSETESFISWSLHVLTFLVSSGAAGAPTE